MEDEIFLFKPIWEKQIMIKVLLLALGRRLTFLLYTAVGDKLFSLPVTARRKFYNRKNEQEKMEIPFHFFFCEVVPFQ